jgi:dihydrofolate synthase / folylpolyglutamate synthase
MRALAHVLGDPHTLAPTIHITGTNGKGSTARMVIAILVAHDIDVGGYTSPHLQRLNERISRNNEPLSDEELAEAISSVASVQPMSGVENSWFEVIAASAFSWFATEAVGAQVIEVGMGGRWDATNIVDADVAVITNVGLDHMEYLGPTRADIAREKAGIVKPDSHLVLGESDPDLLEIFEEAKPRELWVRDRDILVERNALAVGGRVIGVTTPLGRREDVFVPLHGAHQGDNAALAIATAEAFLGRHLDEGLLAEAMATVKVPGRFEIVNNQPLILLDGAHNPDGARAAAATLEQDFSVSGDSLLVVGLTKGRDPAQMLEALGARRARLVVATAPDFERAVPADEIAAAARGLGIDVEEVPSVAEAVARACGLAGEDDTILVAGSLYVVGEARSALLR